MKCPWPWVNSRVSAMTEIFGHLLLRLRQWLGGLRTASIHVTRPTMFGNSQSSMQPRRLPAIDRRLGIRLTVWCDVSISHGTLFFMWREVSIIRRTSISIAWSGRVTGCGSLTMTQHAIWCQVTCHLTSGDLTSQFSGNLRAVYIMQWIVFYASLWILLLRNTNQDQITRPGTRAWISSFSVIKDSGVTAVTVVCVRPTHECCCWRGSWYIAWVKLQRSSKLDTAFTTWQKVGVWQLPAIISSS